MDSLNNQYCQQHKKQIAFICSCQFKYLCSSCFESGNHQNHDIDIYSPQNSTNKEEIAKKPPLLSDKKEQTNRIRIEDDQKKVNEVKGDLLKFDSDIIVQQCNCITTNAKGLSEAIEKRFGVSAYDRRIKGKGNTADIKSIDIPGTCSFDKPKIRLQNSNIKFIANLFSQFAPGKNSFKYQNTLCLQVKDPQTGQTIKDNHIERERWFQQCLEHLSEFAKQQKLYKIAFPFNIGCGLAGGNWENYKKMIKEFQKNNKELNVYIVQLADEK